MRDERPTISGEIVDEIADVVVDKRQRFRDELNNPIAERWLNRKAVLHAHLRVRPRVGESQAQDLCLVFQRKGHIGDPVLQEFPGGVPSDEIRNVLLCGKEHVDDEGAVFIHVVEGLVHSQWITGRVPAVVRLRLLDSCPGLPAGVDALQGTPAPIFLAKPNVAVKVFGVGIDREGVPLTWLAISRKHKFPDEVIQSRSEVVDGVAANEAPPERELLDYWSKVHGVPRSVEGVIDGLSLGVRFKEGGQFAVERVEVFSAPLGLGPGSGRVESHG